MRLLFVYIDALMRLLFVLSGDDLANSSPVDRLGAIDESRNEGVMANDIWTRCH